jgi:hypothetical protein
MVGGGPYYICDKQNYFIQENITDFSTFIMTYFQKSLLPKKDFFVYTKLAFLSSGSRFIVQDTLFEKQNWIVEHR